MFNLNQPRLFRPPAEWQSLILRIAQGCPHNTCTFCGMYKGVTYRVLTDTAITALIARAARTDPTARRVFLADGDVMCLPFARLHAILSQLNDVLPRLSRVSLYANGSAILNKTPDQLRQLRALKLDTLYMGLESGDPQVLTNMHKTETVDTMISAGRCAQDCGLRMSVMVLLGLGGQARSQTHASMTAAALNLMQPRLLSVLHLVPTANTPLWQQLHNGAFRQLSEHAAVCELRNMIAELELEHTVFRANHVSNHVPLEGRLPKDKPQLLATLDQILTTTRLDHNGPGPQPSWL